MFNLPKVDFGINLKSSLAYSKKDTKIFTDILANVLIMEDIPGLAWQMDNDIKNYQGLIIKVSPYQNLETAKQKQILKWKIPTLCHNYSFVPKIDGAISISGCTFNSALIKFMWYLSNAKKLGSFEDSMKQSIIGEFYENLFN